MSDNDGSTGDHIRQHVRGLLEAFRAQQRAQHKAQQPIKACRSGEVEVDGEEDRTAVVRNGQDPA